MSKHPVAIGCQRVADVLHVTVMWSNRHYTVVVPDEGDPFFMIDPTSMDPFLQGSMKGCALSFKYGFKKGVQSADKAWAHI